MPSGHWICGLNGFWVVGRYDRHREDCTDEREAAKDEESLSRLGWEWRDEGVHWAETWTVPGILTEVAAEAAREQAGKLRDEEGKPRRRLKPKLIQIKKQNKWSSIR